MRLTVEIGESREATNSAVSPVAGGIGRSRLRDATVVRRRWRGPRHGWARVRSSLGWISAKRHALNDSHGRSPVGSDVAVAGAGARPIVSRRSSLLTPNLRDPSRSVNHVAPRLRSHEPPLRLSTLQESSPQCPFHSPISAYPTRSSRRSTRSASPRPSPSRPPPSPTPWPVATSVAVPPPVPARRSPSVSRSSPACSTPPPRSPTPWCWCPPGNWPPRSPRNCASSPAPTGRPSSPSTAGSASTSRSRPCVEASMSSSPVRVDSAT